MKDDRYHAIVLINTQFLQTDSKAQPIISIQTLTLLQNTKAKTKYAKFWHQIICDGYMAAVGGHW